MGCLRSPGLGLGSVAMGEMGESSNGQRHQLSIGQLAARSGSRRRLFATTSGRVSCLSPTGFGGRRRYEPDHLQRLAAIRLAKQAGFSLREIERFIRGFSASTPPSARWRQMAGEKLSELDRKAQEIERMQAVLQRGLDCECLTLDECELL